MGEVVKFDATRPRKQAELDPQLKEALIDGLLELACRVEQNEIADIAMAFVEVEDNDPTYQYRGAPENPGLLLKAIDRMRRAIISEYNKGE